MKVEIARGWTALAIAAVLLALTAVVVYFTGDAQSFQAWLAKPLRDASIKDVAVLLIAAAIIAK